MHRHISTRAEDLAAFEVGIEHIEPTIRRCGNIAVCGNSVVYIAPILTPEEPNTTPPLDIIY